jgi:hypothetical protein
MQIIEGRIKVTREIEEELTPDEVEHRIRDLQFRKSRCAAEMQTIDSELTVLEDFKAGNKSLFEKTKFQEVSVSKGGE